MTDSQSYTSFDYEPVFMVPVIASFDAEGHIQPLYVRIMGERYKVHSYWVKTRYGDTIEFNCQLEYENRTMPVLLKYYQRESIWTVPKR